MISSSIVIAHPGGLDKLGGHVNRTTGEYHQHKSTPEITSETNRTLIIKVGSEIVSIPVSEAMIDELNKCPAYIIQ